MNISLRLRYNSNKVLTDEQTLGIYRGRAGLQPCSPPTSPQLLAASMSLILQPSSVCNSRAKQETYSTGKRHWCKGSSTDKAVLLLVLLILPGKDGGCCNKLSCQKRSFARTSYFQPSTQDCCAAVGGGYSCISRLLLMEKGWAEGSWFAASPPPASGPSHPGEPITQRSSDGSGRHSSY